MPLSMTLLTSCLSSANEGIHGTGILLSEVLFLCTLFLGEAEPVLLGIASLELRAESLKLR